MTDQVRPDAPVPPERAERSAPSSDTSPTPPYGTRLGPSPYGDPWAGGPGGPGAPGGPGGPGGAWPPGAPGWGAHPPGSAPGPRAPGGGRRRGLALWLTLGAVFLVALLVAGVVLVLHLGATPSTSTTASPAASPARAPAAVSPTAPAAPKPAGGSAGPGASTAPAAGSTLSTAFTASDGPTCQAYTPGRGEYVTSRGDQATEVRSCGATGGGGLVFTRWATPADAASVVSDQASFPSVDGRAFWTMNGTRQGDWHERTADDGSCVAALDYSAAPYAMLITAPTCSDVDTIFQAITLPDTATVPR